MDYESQTAAVVDRPAPSAAQLRMQLSLRALFLCVTYFSVASLFAVLRSPAVFVIALGFFLTWLSYRGYLWWLQTRSARPRLFGFAWLLFAISFGLPALTVSGCGTSPPTPHYGWQVAWEGVTLFAFVIQTASPTKLQETIPNGLYTIMVNLPNAMMLLSPWLLYRQHRNKGGDLPAAWGCAAVSSWTWSLGSSSDLKIGYYIWSAAITVEFLRRKSGVRSLLAMGFFAAAFFLLNWLA